MCDMEVEGTSRKQSLCLYTIHQQRVPQKEPDRSKEKDGGGSWCLIERSGNLPLKFSALSLI